MVSEARFEIGQGTQLIFHVNISRDVWRTKLETAWSLPIGAQQHWKSGGLFLRHGKGSVRGRAPGPRFPFDCRAIGNTVGLNWL
jgi:hypothetical protein